MLRNKTCYVIIFFNCTYFDIDHKDLKDRNDQSSELKHHNDQSSELKDLKHLKDQSSELKDRNDQSSELKDLKYHNDQSSELNDSIVIKSKFATKFEQNSHKLFKFSQWQFAFKRKIANSKQLSASQSPKNLSHF